MCSLVPTKIWPTDLKKLRHIDNKSNSSSKSTIYSHHSSIVYNTSFWSFCYHKNFLYIYFLFTKNTNSLDDSTLISCHHHYYFPRISNLGLLMDQSEEKQCAATLRIKQKKKCLLEKFSSASWTTHKRYLRWLSVISLLKSDIKNFMEELETLWCYMQITCCLYIYFSVSIISFSHFIFVYIVVLLKVFFFFNFFIDTIYRHASIELLQCVRMVQ